MNRKLLLGAAALLVLAITLIFVFTSGEDGKEAAGDLREISFVTDWKAQAEQGGFYQAKALGLYEEAGLDVTIRQGGPGVNVPQLVITGAADMGLGSNSFIPLNARAAGAELKAVMASFQKDPQVLITHPREDVKSIADMKGKPIMVSDATVSAFWIWLRVKFGFSDNQIRKYTFNLAPFLSDPEAIQQGYLSSEPYSIEKEAGFEPQVFLLSDYGYPGYGAMVLAPDSLIESEPEVVQAFVDATIKGWLSYLHGDPSPGNALILEDNPEMTADLLAHAISEMKAYGIVESGDTETLGVGAMTHERWEEFFTLMAAEGVYDPAFDYRAAYTLDFINKGPVQGSE
ncbi:ABC transporter substrate-binding protein [Tepidicaulis sp. LMO-SS28]|uniref:ABC transporter substrate-binding protein n=1 Tax=Tepidicaulis sp. LMO-SS28 TaxID=3447455 RepID=UPI003EDF8622